MDSLGDFKDFISFIVLIASAASAFFFLLKARPNALLKAQLELEKPSSNESADVAGSYQNQNDVSLSTNDRQFVLLRQYHSQGLAQSRISFWFSLIFASLGFIIIVVSILTVDKDKSLWTQPNSLISLISGTIIDAVSALFFVQSNKSRELMSTFFEKLRTDRKIEESLNLAESIPDEILRSKLKMILSLHFAEIVTSDSIVSIVFKDLEKSVEVTTEKS